MIAALIVALLNNHIEQMDVVSDAMTIGGFINHVIDATFTEKDTPILNYQMFNSPFFCVCVQLLSSVSYFILGGHKFDQ